MCTAVEIKREPEAIVEVCTDFNQLPDDTTQLDCAISNSYDYLIQISRCVQPLNSITIKFGCQTLHSTSSKAILKMKFVVQNIISEFYVLMSNDFVPLLSSVNPLQHHSLPPTDSKEYLRCCVCLDEFSCSNSLDRHVKRASVRIFFTCTLCEDSPRLEWHNKCALFHHFLLKHKNFENSLEKPLDLTSLTTSPLSDSFFKQVDTVTDGEITALRKNISAIVNSCSNRKIVEASDDPNLFCPVCKADVPNLCSHLETESERQDCPACDATLLNKCLFILHMCIHANTGLNVCPECGKYFAQDRMFAIHLGDCLHFNRVSGFSCSLCELHFVTVNSLAQHYHKKHALLYHKCTSCSLAFRTLTAYDQHCLTSGHASDHSPNHKIIRCPLCSSTSLNSSLFLTHLMQKHISSCKPIYYYKCEACSMVFEKKLDLISHHSQCRPHLTSLYICDFCHKGFVSFSALCTHRESTHWQIRISPFEDSALGLHFPCVTCNLKFASVGHLAFHEAEYHKIFTCIYHSDNSIMGRLAFENHMTTSHADSIMTKAARSSSNKKFFQCRFCSRMFASLVKRMHHITHFHRSALACTPCCLTFTEPGLCVSHFASHHVDSDETASSTYSRFEKFVATLHSNDNNESVPAKIPRESGDSEEFTCYHCGHRSASRISFQKHIATHSDPAMLSQCSECGQSFVVENGLIRHLRIVHNIKEYEKYREELSKKLNDHHLEDLRCTVCFQTFTSQTELNIHRRTHGMAFIKSRRK